MADVDNTLDGEIARSDLDIQRQPKERDPRLYKMMPDSRIPVSKQLGPLWESRKRAGLRQAEVCREAWNEAIRYYNNDQSPHRNARHDGSGNDVRQHTNQWTYTENIVFANAAAQLPSLYSRNPTSETTAHDESEQPFADVCDKLVNALFSRRDAPYVPMKARARRAILTAILTNSGWLKLGWIDKADGSEGVLEQLNVLAQEYEKAKTREEIEDIEGKLAALEEMIDLLDPAGPTCSCPSPFDIIVDPEATQPDLSDARWIIEMGYLPTSYVIAKYLQGKERDDDNYKTLFQPTHVINPGSTHDDGTDDAEYMTYSSVDGDRKHRDFGFDDQDTFTRSCMTRVAWVWDKTTRRLLLFHDSSWKYPLWVWDDPLKLPRFFPYFHLHFHESTMGVQSKGEVTYYLDQQDAVNDTLSAKRLAMRWVQRTLFYNSRVIRREDAERVLKGEDIVIGVDVPDGQRLDEAFSAPIHPTLKLGEFTDTSEDRASIDRISSLSQIARGNEFRTNTTNDAIAVYQQAAETRTDERTDAIEDWIGDFAYNLAMLCARYMDTEQVANIVGAKAAENWVQQDPAMFSARFSMQVVGGSTQKPTSQAKKRMALETGQVLGQFASGSPAIVLVMLKMFSRAFEDVVITDEDWNLIIQSIVSSIQGPQGSGEERGSTAAGGEEEIRRRVANLPPEAQQAVRQLIEQGTPPTEALQTVEANGNG